MKNILFLGLMLFFLSANSFAQEPSISADTIVVNLTITSFQGKKLETEVGFENLSTHKLKKYKTNKQGETQVILLTDERYQIGIPESDDNYEYSIPDFSISPLALAMKFHLRQ